MNTTAAIGYFILAAKDHGWDKRDIERLAVTMREMTYVKSEHEAQKAYMEN